MNKATLTLLMALLPTTVSFANDSFSNSFNGTYSLVSSHDHVNETAQFRECYDKIRINTSNSNKSLNMEFLRDGNISNAIIDFNNGCKNEDLCEESTSQKFEITEHYIDDNLGIESKYTKKFQIQGEKLLIVATDDYTGVFGLVAKVIDRLSDGSDIVKCEYKRD